MSDYIKTTMVELQENGIIRNSVGVIIGMLVTDAMQEARETHLTELETQLADAKQAARWESDLASQALAALVCISIRLHLQIPNFFRVLLITPANRI